MINGICTRTEPKSILVQSKKIIFDQKPLQRCGALIGSVLRYNEEPRSITFYIVAVPRGISLLNDNSGLNIL